MSKSFYYVVVCSEQQAKFVTGIDNATKYAHWDSNKAPKNLSKSLAEDLAYCLNLNFYPAFVLKSFYEIEEQIFLKGGN